MKRLIFGIVMIGGFLFCGNEAQAQVLTPEDDGIIPQPTRHYKHNKVFPYPYLRESDILWSTRHWERIDLRQKFNHHLYYPLQKVPDRKSLFDVIVDGIINEGTIVEVFADDRFEIPLTPEQVQGYVQMVDTIRDPDDPSIIRLVDTIEITSKDVLFWEVKSDWFFNKHRSEMKNRVIGISPVVRNPKTQDKYNLFWVWFPDARYALSTHVAFNRRNNMKRFSYDQVFQLRFFQSTIYKESNVYDREIEDYKRNDQIGQLLEARQIKNNLRNFEHDLWEY